MSRTVITVCVGVSLCALSVGCANFMESRAIAQFAKALEDKELASLKTRSSDEFQQVALRHAKALEDFEILRLPEGKPSIVGVKEGDTKNEKRITVEVGKNKKKLLYRVVRSEKTGKWVVDDIYVRQKKQGLEVVRSVKEQMNLLLTVREFLETWDGAKRSRVLAITTPELQAVLGGLPEPYLKRLTREVVGRRSRMKKLRPKAELDEDIAIVTLPRTTGKMILSLRQIGENWKVADVAVESKDKEKQIPSVLKTATALRASLQFLTAYETADKRSLANLCAKQLWDESLKHATRDDMSAVRLIPQGVGKVDYKMQMLGHRGQFILEGRDEWLKISLIKDKEAPQPGTPMEYRVEDVTIYRLKDKQVVRLSSRFMAKEILQIFTSALAGQRRKVLRHVSTAEFNRRVWDGADAAFLRSAIPIELVSNRPQILETKYQGPVTQIAVQQGRRKVTYILRDRDGRVRVDDIIMPQPGLPDSVRERLELQLPIYRFAAALRSDDIPALQRASSSDFNRTTWKMAKHVPPAGMLAPKYLKAPLTSVSKFEGKTVVLLGSSTFGAKVLIAEEHSRPVIDDVLMVAGIEPREKAKLKHLTRRQMVLGRRVATDIQRAQYTRPPATGRTPVTTADFPIGGMRPESGNPTSRFQPDDSAFSNAPVRPSRGIPPRVLDTPSKNARPISPFPPTRQSEFGTQRPTFGDSTGRSNVAIPRGDNPFAAETPRHSSGARSRLPNPNPNSNPSRTFAPERYLGSGTR